MSHYLGRVSMQHHNIYSVIMEADGAEVRARTAGSLSRRFKGNADYPAVGDWVKLDRESGENGDAVICEMLARKSALIRKEAGLGIQGQVIAANIDYVFICMSLNQDYNLKRLDRYIAVSSCPGIIPIVVLTKADLNQEAESMREEAMRRNPLIQVILCSDRQGVGFDRIRSIMTGNVTAAFIGSSGVGKSTIINRLLGTQAMLTNAVREDDGKGRHTTTHRQLIRLEGGGTVIDTPGMRELYLDGGNIGDAFSDIAELAALCRFRDCSHLSEPDCAVKAAVESGKLSKTRYMNYLKLMKEKDNLKRKRRTW